MVSIGPREVSIGYVLVGLSQIEIRKVSSQMQTIPEM